MYEDVTYDTADGIARIVIDRPTVHNAFTRRTIDELNDAIRTATGDDDVYVLVLTGADGSFCAGADVDSMPDWSDQTEAEYAAYLREVQNVVRQLRTTPKPVVGAVEGPAIGAGCDFALVCDLRVVGPSTVLREGFVRVGLVPGDGGGWLLPRLVGEAKAKKYLLTGKDIDAEAAVDIGLATEVADEPMDEALALAARMRDLPAVAVRRTKQLTDPALSFEEYCARAVEYQWECVNDPEHEEAIAAFADGRDPEYDRP
jgi:enoyl-CoA hydratase/carnithine racemase